MAHPTRSRLQLLTYPYDEVITPEAPSIEESIRTIGRKPGTAVVWRPDRAVSEGDRRLVAARPGAAALIVILPPAADLANDAKLWERIAGTRPHALLPHHEHPDPADLAQVLRKPPEDIGAAVTDYLRSRGWSLDGDTRHLVRRTLELSADLASVSSLSRSLYLSRRALGRRFALRGLPVPSHWLQFGRVLRLALRVQNSDASIHSIAIQQGYPDGFAASNQAFRLVGYRPSDLRRYLGWEWILDAWWRKEAQAGALSTSPPEPVRARSSSGMRSRHTRSRRAAS